MKSLESGDPFELVGVPRVGDADLEADRETARCIVEDYVLTGFSGREISQIFASPAYGLPHAIYRRRGAEFVASLVGEVFGGAK